MATVQRWESTQNLIDNLHLWGISYLTGGSGKPFSPLPAAELLQGLALSDDPRVRTASISLMLLHPTVAVAIDEVLHNNHVGATEELAILTLATLYLQRCWRTRLTMALGHAPTFPEDRFQRLWRERNLPLPAAGDGQWGIAALERYQQQHTGWPVQYHGDWHNQIDHLCRQEAATHREHPAADLVLPTVLAWEIVPMSMRPPVGKAEIEQFLTVLGQTVRHPGQLFLVGGAALVHMGIRTGTTEDIDIAMSSAHEQELVDEIRKLAQQYNVEFASPSDFIPLPKQTQPLYVGRYGILDVFYYDFVSLALSKIARGQDRDFRDVVLLLQHGMFTLDQLESAYQEIEPQLGQVPFIRLSPHHFAERFAALRLMIQGT